MVIQLRINGPNGVDKIIDLCDNEQQLKKITVEQLRDQINKQLTITGDFRVVFRTEKLKESRLLVYYKIKHMSTVHVVLSLEGGI